MAAFPTELPSKSDILASLYRQIAFEEPKKIVPLAASGSNRQYFRIFPQKNDHPALIGTIGENRDENLAFIGLAKHFAEKGLSVPKVLVASPDSMAYIQTDVGAMALFDAIKNGRTTGTFSDKEVELLEAAMELLANVQVKGAKGLDFSICFPSPAFCSRMVDWDLSYFKYCFLKPSEIDFSEEALQDDFDRLSRQVLSQEFETFMVRDFQSRNLMIGSDGRLSLIDFQGGRCGPAEYDVASFLWQARAKIPSPLKERLIGTYIKERQRIDPSFDGADFQGRLPLFVLLRTLQVLGAYGFRGLVERKAHFLESIPPALQNLSEILSPDTLGPSFPYLAQLSKKLLAKHQPLPLPEGLTVKVWSFSYKKGVPQDNSGNGGGFVFDCRATHNPGRYEPFKQLTGLDRRVVDFLEHDGEIEPFYHHAEALVFASVERYIQRGFSSLTVAFGCTGGQHRSVYCAQRLANRLNEKYGLRVELSHREQNINLALQRRPETSPVFCSFLKEPQKTWTPQ